MKTHELASSDDNIIETLQKDPIQRNKDLFRFLEILNSIDFGCSIALDGDWGSGKTFFVKQAKAIFEANNPMYSGEGISSLKALWEAFAVKKGIVLENSVAIYYDAWMNDNDVDPMLSIIYEIIKQTGINYIIKPGVNPNEITGSIASEIVNHFTGFEIKKYFDACKQEDYLKEIKDDKELYQQIISFFDAVLAERGNRLVLFIDELDRCKPDYAVRLLERVKHYFNNDRATYVFAINSSELQHTIKRYYGEGFDATRYLDRFFDLRISMPKPDMRKYYDLIGFPNTSYIIDDVCENVIERYGFSLRETERYLRIVKMAVYNAIHNDKISTAYFPEEKGRALIATCIAPILLGARVADIDKYKNFISGKDSSLLLEMIREDVGKSYSNYMLCNDESFDEKNENKKYVKFKDKLQEIYDAIFVEKYTSDVYEKYVGDMSFSKESKGKLIDIINLFSSITVLGDD